MYLHVPYADEETNDFRRSSIIITQRNKIINV